MVENMEMVDVNSRVKLQPTWKNEPTYSDLSGDKIEAQSAQDVVRSNVLRWREIRDGGPKVETRAGRSTTRPKVVRKQYEWKYPAYEDPFLNTPDMFTALPRTGEDNETAKKNGLLLNYQWEEEVGKTRLIKAIVRKIVDDGTVITKTGWDAEYGTKIVEKEEPIYAEPEESMAIIQESVQNGQMSQEEAKAMIEMGQPVQKGTKKICVEEEVLVKNRPTYSVRNIMNVFIDPTCNGVIEDAKFLIEEYDTSYAELKKDEYTKTINILEDGTKEIIEKGMYHNIDKINLENAEEIVDEYETDSRNSFQYSDKARKKIRANEYWGYWDIQGDGILVPIVATWINGVIIRMEENPFPHKRIPYSVASYLTVVDSTYGEPDAEVLEENQNSIGKMIRAAEDITGTQAVGQEFIDENFFGITQRNAYEKGNDVYYRSGFDPRTAIYRRKVEPVDSTVFKMIDMQQKEAESMSGTIAFNGGNGGSIMSGSATGIRSAMDATSKRELSILRNISELLKDMARMTITMNQSYMPEEQIVRITNDKHIFIRKDDLSGKIDIKLEISTPEKDNETADKLMTLMQTNAANMDPKIAAMHYEKIARLWKMPDLADKVANFKPEPNPVQEQIQQLQLENARLENEKLKVEMTEAYSRMEERVSRTTENEADIRKKNAEAALKEAAAGKLTSETDELDRKFMKEMTGQGRREHIEDQEFNDRAKQEDRMDKHSIEMDKLDKMHMMQLYNNKKDK